MNDLSRKLAALLLGGSLLWGGPALSFSQTQNSQTISQTQNGQTDSGQFTSQQKEAIQNIVHDYLVNNPQVLIEASRALQAKQEKAMETYTQTAIAQHRKELFNSNSPVVGNPKGKITIIEFFDYQCIHCKEMAPILQATIKDDPKIRVVYKELPIFGGDSKYAARAALAAQLQGKYEVLHNALMASKQRLNQNTVLDIARKAGLNMKRLQADMLRGSIKRALNTNLQLAKNLRLMGTPAIIVGPNMGGPNAKQFFVPGVVREAALQRLVQQANG